MNKKRVTAVAMAAFGTVPATAGVFDTFDSRAAWLASAGGPVQVEDFEGRDAFGPLGPLTAFDSGLELGLSGAAVDNAGVEAGDPNGFGLQNTTVGGSQYARFGGDFGVPFGDYTLQFLLPETVGAFGFDISDWEPGRISDGPQGANVELYNDDALVFGFFLPSTLNDDGGLSFIGFTTSVFFFDEVRLTIADDPVSGIDVVGIDEVSWVVPTPGAAVVIGAASLVSASRRRRA